MTRTLVRFLSQLSLAVLLAGQTVFGQGGDAPGRASFRLGLTAGLTTFNLGDLRDYTSEVLSIYNSAGVPLELQREYPPNLQAGAEVLYLGLEPWAIGLSGSYTWTSAYALYADYAGTLDLTSRVRVLSGNLVVQYAFPAGSALQPFIDFRGGISWVFLSLEETVDATDFAGVRSDGEISGDKVTFGGEASAGLRYTFGSLAFTGRAGYRYSNVSSMEVEVTSSGQSMGSGTLAFDINASGFVGVLTFEVVL